MRLERGQTLVLVALAMAVLLGIIGLALDGGNAYLQRRKMQTAADAGALAAAKALCEGRTDWVTVGEIVCERAAEAGRPGNEAEKCTITSPSSKKAAALAEGPVTLLFGQIVGFEGFTARAYSEAGCSPALAVGNLLPFALTLGGSFETGKSYSFYDQEKEGAGMFGMVGWGNYFGEGATYQYYDWDDSADFPPDCSLKGADGSIVNPDLCSPIVMIGDTIPKDRANSLNAVFEELWGGKHGNETYPGWACQEVVIPLVAPDPDDQSKLYTVVGFGSFVLTGMCPTGQNSEVTCVADETLDDPNLTCDSSEKIVRGRFVDYVTGPLGGGEADTGVYVVNLTQ